MATTTNNTTTNRGRGARSPRGSVRKPLGHATNLECREQGEMFESDAEDVAITSRLQLRSDLSVEYEIIGNSVVRISAQAISDLAELTAALLRHNVRAQDCHDRFVEISPDGVTIDIEVRVPASRTKAEHGASLQRTIKGSLARYEAVSEDPMAVIRQAIDDDTELNKIKQALNRAKATKKLVKDTPLGLTMSVDGGADEQFQIAPAKPETKDAVRYVECRLEPDIEERQIVITQVHDGQYVDAIYNGADAEKYKLPPEYKATIGDEIIVFVRPKKKRQLELFVDVVRVVEINK